MLPPSLNPSNHDNPSESFSLSNLKLDSDFLKYQWKFTNCTEFCEAFGIGNKALLEAVFEKIKNLTIEGSDAQLFQQLYQDEQTPLFIKKIIAFPEFKAYLITRNAEHCISLISEKISYCAHYKTQLAHIISLFKTKPVEACIALVRFTHSAKTLPEGEQKNQLLWLIDQTRQAWYKENFLIHHALNGSFLNAYLDTHPQWLPCIDFILTIAKNNHDLTADQLSEILSLIHYNTTLFCEALSQTEVVHQFDAKLFDVFLIKQPDALPDFLKLTQHRIDRFTLWSNWIALLPSSAPLIFIHWQNHLNHLSTESASQEKVFFQLAHNVDNGIISLSEQSKKALEKINLSIQTLKKPALTNHEKDALPEAKRYILTEMALLFSVKACGWMTGSMWWKQALASKIHNQYIAKCLKVEKIEQTTFEQVKYNLYSLIGKPLSGNRMFKYTANESFKKTFLNGFKIYSDKKASKQYCTHLKNPTMTDAEFYERVLAKP